MLCVVIRSYIRSADKTYVNTSIMININIFKVKFVGNKHIFKFYCCLAVLHLYIVVFPCQNQPKMMYIYGLATCFQPFTRPRRQFFTIQKREKCLTETVINHYAEIIYEISLANKMLKNIAFSRV